MPLPEPKNDPDRYAHTEYRDRFRKNDEGKNVKTSRVQIFENGAGDKLALPLDIKTGRPIGEIVRFVE